jgi:hypothetical protein
MTRIFTLIFTLATLTGFAQEKSHKWRKALVVPSVLVTAGLVTLTDNEVFDNWEIKALRDEHASHFHTTADNYLQFSPLAATILLKASGVKSQHDWTNLTLLMLKSELIMTAIVFPTKHLTNNERPNGASFSFPSGHTAEAFMAATILHKEFGKDHPVISILGYATASGVGILRVMNNRHWTSDVLVGAGIGILSTNLVYLTHRNKWPKKNSILSNMSVSPSWSRGTTGLSMVLRLK